MIGMFAIWFQKVLGAAASDCSEAQLDRLRKTYDLDGDGQVKKPNSY